VCPNSRGRLTACFVESSICGPTNGLPHLGGLDCLFAVLEWFGTNPTRHHSNSHFGRLRFDFDVSHARSSHSTHSSLWGLGCLSTCCGCDGIGRSRALRAKSIGARAEEYVPAFRAPKERAMSVRQSDSQAPRSSIVMVTTS
jgi:hypothetical protein